jgi:uncharacterized protein with HEPN domain
MPFDREADRLEDIREAIRHAQVFVAGIDFDQFSRDIKTAYAVTRCLEIISEASRRLDADFRSRYPELPWSQIAGAGNVYRHDYPVIRPDMVRDTVHKALPPLLAAVEAELARKR